MCDKIRPLRSDLLEKAVKELNENPQTVEEDIDRILEWIEKQPHIVARKDRQWILSFLRGCKFSIEKTKQKLEAYYSSRTLFSDLTKPLWSDPKFRTLCECGVGMLLSGLDYKGRKVSISLPGFLDINTYAVLETTKVFSAIQDIMIMDDDDAVVSGSTFIVDLSDISMAYLAQCTIVNLKKILCIGMHSVPLRVGDVHILNPPTGGEAVINLFKTLISDKLKSRLFVYGKNRDKLYEMVPKETLPIEYGGTGGSIKDIKEKWLKTMEEHASFFEENSKFGTDESKRVGKSTFALDDDLFGTAGSFKKLEID